LPSVRESNSLKNFKFHSKGKRLVEISFASEMDEAFEQIELDQFSRLKKGSGKAFRSD
jgi:hypothetical protein